MEDDSVSVEQSNEGESAGSSNVKEGIASIALLPSGSLSGHFIHLPHSVCYGLHGTELACERECSHGDDYRLIKLIISDYTRKKERVVVVECKGQDAAQFHTIDHAHGWDKDVVGLVEQSSSSNGKKKKISVSFVCETLKADKVAEDHITKFMPKLTGLDAVVNIGRMKIVGLDFDKGDDSLDLDNNNVLKDGEQKS